MDKKTLSRAASKFALKVTDFLAIKPVPGTEAYRTEPDTNDAPRTGQDEEPYWMKDDFWDDSVELQTSGKIRTNCLNSSFALSSPCIETGFLIVFSSKQQRP